MKPSLIIGLAVFSLLCLQANSQDAREYCWETCFKQYANTENVRYRDVLAELLGVIYEIKELIVLNNIQKVGLLFDSSISQRLDPNYNPDILRSPTKSTETATYLQYFSSIIGHILTFSLDRALYLVQYNQNNAWGCDGYQGTNSCNYTRVIRAMILPELGPNAHCPGNVEAGCSLMSRFMSTIASNFSRIEDEELLVVLTFKDFHTPMTKFQSHDPLCPKPSRKGLFRQSETASPCSQFRHRYVIGLHSGTDEYMREFASNPRNYRMIRQTLFSYNSLRPLFQCIAINNPRACCLMPGSGPGAPNQITVRATRCSKTAGPFGEIIQDFPTHYAIPLLGTAGFIPNPTL